MTISQNMTLQEPNRSRAISASRCASALGDLSRELPQMSRTAAYYHSLRVGKIAAMPTRTRGAVGRWIRFYRVVWRSIKRDARAVAPKTGKRVVAGRVNRDLDMVKRCRS